MALDDVLDDDDFLDDDKQDDFVEEVSDVPASLPNPKASAAPQRVARGNKIKIKPLPDNLAQRGVCSVVTTYEDGKQVILLKKRR